MMKWISISAISFWEVKTNSACKHTADDASFTEELEAFDLNFCRYRGCRWTTLNYARFKQCSTSKTSIPWKPVCNNCRRNIRLESFEFVGINTQYVYLFIGRCTMHICFSKRRKSLKVFLRTKNLRYTRTII